MSNDAPIATIDTAPHNPAGGIRQFTPSGQADPEFAVYPPSLVRIVRPYSGDGDEQYVVEYLEPVDGVPAGHRFYVMGRELTRITSPIFDIGHLWVVVVPGFPTFYLNGAVQGIQSKLDAAKIAAGIIGEQASVGPSNIDRLIDILI
jgi:hypothetical protein